MHNCECNFVNLAKGCKVKSTGSNLLVFVINGNDFKLNDPMQKRTSGIQRKQRR